MAKDSKPEKTETKKARTPPTPPKMEKPEYGVEAVAEGLGVTPFVARQKMRSAGVAKEGRQYSFKNQKEVDAVVKQLKAGEPKAAKTDADKPAKESKKKAA